MERLDVILTTRFGFPRTYAQEVILSGLVSSEGRPLTKPGMKVDEEINLTVPDGPEFLSRAGNKLKHGLDFFYINIQGLICLDVGASTGGFTQCMLSSGAEMVFALDVGSDQLDKSLVMDSRVINLEKTHVNSLENLNLPPIDFFTADLSFISVTKALPHIKSVLKPGATGIILIKPQFEMGEIKGGMKYLKNGIIKDERARILAIKNVEQTAIELGYRPAGLTTSGITGKQGNVEYLMKLCL